MNTLKTSKAKGRLTMKTTRRTVVAADSTGLALGSRALEGLFLLASLTFAVTGAASAQGILTVTPSRSVAITAGTGAVGLTGNGRPAASATVAAPGALAFDAQGNLYFADTLNHVVREVSSAGVITVVAGAGIEGYGGDGAAATAAYLDTPTGVAVDTSGNLYIADSHNHRIREVSGGVISTIAGTGVPGFAGDGAAATAAQLWDPMGVAVDSNGNVYIADTNNHRIRKISGTIISTIAGDGEQFFGGDGAAATSAVLDSPTSVAVDAAGTVYVADRHNQRVRMISGTTITTIAGSGAPSFSGGFSGDGASAIAATLARPSGVSVDASGNIYIADTGNQRIRELGGGAIATVAGSGQQGFGGDGSAPSSVNLNSPRSAAPDALGNLSISDTLNQLIRAAALPTLTFANDGVGVLSPTQSVTLANTGAASIAVAAVNFTGGFVAAAGGSCAATPPITLAAGATCTQNIAFLPATVGAANGSVVFSGTGIVPQSILLAGAAVTTATTTTLVSSSASPFVTQTITFTATVLPISTTANSVKPTGTVSFFDGATLIGTAQTLAAGGTASISTATLAAGPHNITAVYSGDANFIPSTSAPLVQTVLDFNFTLTPANPNGVSSQTVMPGQTAVFAFNLQPIGGPFTFPVALSATGLPPGATVTFTPNPITMGATPASFTMSIQVPQPVGSLQHRGLYGGSTVALALLLLPFSSRIRRATRRLRPLPWLAVLLLSIGAIGGLAGCASGSGFFGVPQQTYTINVIGTATGTGAVVLQRTTTVTLTVQ